jgi:enamine deaminase RidA (YjgF/YER057c/UK114 family)
VRRVGRALYPLRRETFEIEILEDPMNSLPGDRRSFLLQSAAALSAVGAATSLPALASAQQGGPEQRLRQLGIELPTPQGAMATLVPAVITGNLLFVSGHGPRGFTPSSGKLGADLTVEQGAAAARAVGINVLATVRNALGSLDRVVKVVKVLGMVNSAPDFTNQSQVVNVFSELMMQVFGEENGNAARSAVGMASLPAGWPIEVEGIFEIRA